MARQGVEIDAAPSIFNFNLKMGKLTREVKEEQMKKAVLRVGGKPISKGKVRINILLVADVVAYFKSQAEGRGYQTLINEALKANPRPIPLLKRDRGRRRRNDGGEHFSTFCETIAL